MRDGYEKWFTKKFGHPPMPLDSRQVDFCWHSYQAVRQQLAAKQAEVDALMLEYCPSEMSQEQLDTWAAHQRPSEWKTNDELRQQLAERDRYPVAWMTTDEDGSPAMLFFDKQEALMFSGDDGPVPLYKEANNRRRQAGALRRSGEPKEQGK